MTVYFVRRKDDASGPIKIGFTRKLDARLQQLNSEYPGGVELLASCKGGAALEGAIHRRLADHRIDGEWFQAAPAVLNVLRAAKTGIPEADDPVTRDRVLPEDEFAKDIRIETRFYLNELMKREWRGYGDSLEGARDRVLDRIGVARSQGKALFHRLQSIKTVSGDVYRLLNLAYCEALYAEGKAEARHLNVLKATHNLGQRLRSSGVLAPDEGYVAPWADASAGATLPGKPVSMKAGAAAW